MGKASIISGGEDGSYTIKIDTGKATQTARLAKIDARLAELGPLIAAADLKLLISDAILSGLQAAVETTINAYVAASRADGATPASIQTALNAYVAATGKLNAERVINGPLLLDLQKLRAEQTELTKDRATWAALVLEQTQQAWCADLTDDATGDVATIEIPGEDKLVLIAPAAPPPTAADGVLTAREVQSPEQAFFNAAILPGWQKHKPTYRRGTITAINTEADTADVTLDATDASSAQNLSINQTPTLTGVPVVYMSCNAGAFEVGDRCVVKFYGQSWDAPKIVGFVDHPKPCDGPVVLTMAVAQEVPPGYGGAVLRHFLHCVYDLSKAEVKEVSADMIMAPYDFTYPHLMNGQVNQLYTVVSASLVDAPAGYQTIRVNASSPYDIGQKIICPGLDAPRKEVVCIDFATQLKVQVLGANYSFLRESSTWPGAGYAYTVSAYKGRAAVGGWLGGGYGVQIINHVTGELQHNISLGDDYIHQVALTKYFLAVSCYNVDNDAYLRLYHPDTGELIVEQLIQMSSSNWSAVTAQGRHIAVMFDPTVTWVGGATATANDKVRFYRYDAEDGLVFVEEKTDLFTARIAGVAEWIIAAGGSAYLRLFATPQAGR